MTKATIGSHAGNVDNPLSFLAAYEHVLTHPGAVYQTTGNQTEFRAEARITRKGNHVGEKAIRILPHNEYVYECCWGHRTNCARGGSYIDCYTPAIH